MTAYVISILSGVAAFIVVTAALWAWTRWQDRLAAEAVDAGLPDGPTWTMSGLIEESACEQTREIEGCAELVYGKHSKCREKPRADAYSGRHHSTGVVA